jgi:hypothetical protein
MEVLGREGSDFCIQEGTKNNDLVGGGACRRVVKPREPVSERNLVGAGFGRAQGISVSRACVSTLTGNVTVALASFAVFDWTSRQTCAGVGGIRALAQAGVLSWSDGNWSCQLSPARAVELRTSRQVEMENADSRRYLAILSS